MADLPTREQCKKCGTRGWSFYSPIWEQVAGPFWEHEQLCVTCFGELGDERNLRWEDGLVMSPSSINTHHALIESGAWDEPIREWKEPEPDHLDIDETDDKERVFSIARHAAKRYLELCGQGDGAWGRVTEFLDDAALGIGGNE